MIIIIVVVIISVVVIIIVIIIVFLHISYQRTVLEQRLLINYGHPFYSHLNEQRLTRKVITDTTRCDVKEVITTLTVEDTGYERHHLTGLQ